jgi:probable HAF family extracellular repeat protein
MCAGFLALFALVFTSCQDIPTSTPDSPLLNFSGEQGGYQIINLNAGSCAYDINNRGQIVGEGADAFLWDDGEITYLADGGAAWAINERGQIAGFDRATTVWITARLWDHRGTTSLGSLGSAPGGEPEASWARGINNRGQVVGSYRKTEGGNAAFLWEDGVMNELPVGDYSEAHDINNRGQIVGWRVVEGALGGFLWEDGVVTELGIRGHGSHSHLAINEHGQVVGNCEVAPGIIHACLWEVGVITDLGALGGIRSHAADINNKGQVVGWWMAALWEPRAFLWEVGVMIDLGTLEGRERARAFAINDAGQIVGCSYQDWIGEGEAVLWTRRP